MISGIFLFDVENGNHCLFRSPYANLVVTDHFFPEVRLIDLRKNEDSEDIKSLSSIMFWNKVSKDGLCTPNSNEQ